MTTEIAAAQYLAEHLSYYATRKYAIYNPNNMPLENLPTIYGFNNGGSGSYRSGCILAEDGICLGSHMCSHQGYMVHDLGVIEGSRPDRHIDFQAHYPNGYKMDFVSKTDIDSHSSFQIVLQRALALSEDQ